MKLEDINYNSHVLFGLINDYVLKNGYYNT